MEDTGFSAHLSLQGGKTAFEQPQLLLDRRYISQYKGQEFQSFSPWFTPFRPTFISCKWQHGILFKNKIAPNEV